MAQIDYPQPIKLLIEQMKGLPGIGPRSAERLVLWLMGRGQGRVAGIADALMELESKVQSCESCGFYCERENDCQLCADATRDRTILCVVETASDVLKLERSRAFHGLYHVLNGKLAPLDNVTPADLHLTQLWQRVDELAIEEVILALGADVEGEVTANYIADHLREYNVRITRLARGMPAGGGLEQVDEMTLYQALQGRH